MSRTKTNRRTDREQYTRSNAATARLLTLVKPAETLARDWPNTNERRGMVTSTITLLYTILQTIHQIDWDSVTSITYFTDYYQQLTLESWFTNLEQIPLNHSQQLPAPYKRLIVEIKHNYKRMTEELTIWLTIDRSKRTNYWLQVFIANNIMA